jgi:hypothetical protein
MVVHVGFVVDTVLLGQAFLWVLHVLLPVVIPPVPHAYLLSSEAGIVSQFEATGQKDSVSSHSNDFTCIEWNEIRT